MLQISFIFALVITLQYIRHYSINLVSFSLFIMLLVLFYSVYIICVVLSPYRNAQCSCYFSVNTFISLYISSRHLKIWLILVSKFLFLLLFSCKHVLQFWVYLLREKTTIHHCLCILVCSLFCFSFLIYFVFVITPHGKWIKPHYYRNEF